VLNDTWCLYFHDPGDTNWNFESYKRVCGSLCSAEEYWQYDTALRGRLDAGMFFLMREHVFPSWDDPANINGACVSAKVPKEDLHAFWEQMVVRMLGETLTKDPAMWSAVNGLSCSPKRHFCIVKLWLADLDVGTKRAFWVPPSYNGDIIVRSNRENITDNYAGKK
jgi:hypothetical protein